MRQTRLTHFTTTSTAADHRHGGPTASSVA